jgi:drug/metabolite transporter (DMT)-like permease
MLLGYAIPYAVQPLFIARTGSSSLAAMGVGFTPLFTLALSVPILGVRPTVKQTIGVVGALACLALLLVDSLQRSLMWLALANIWLRMSLSDLPPLELTTICLCVSGLILLPLACALPNPVIWQASQLPTSLVCLLVLGVFGTGLGMLMFNHLVQQQGPLFAAMITNLVPLGAVILGWFDAERVTALQIAALVGVLCCVAIVQWGAMTTDRK